MSGKQEKRDRKIAKLGAQRVMSQINDQMHQLVRPRPRWMPAFVFRRLLKMLINIDRIPQ